MKNLEDYTNHFRDLENVYYLNKKGRELVGSKKVVAKTPNYLHTLMRNDIYIHFKQPKLWVSEYKVHAPAGIFIADALFSVDGTQYFLEVDRLQKMSENYNKLKRYKEFGEAGLWQKVHGGRFPIILFYTDKDKRKQQLIEKNPGISLQVLTVSEIR